MAIERTLPMLSVMLPDTVKLVSVPTDVIAGCAAVVTVPAVVANTAVAINVAVFNVQVTAVLPLNVDPLNPVPAVCAATVE